MKILFVVIIIILAGYITFLKINNVYSGWYYIKLIMIVFV